MFVVTIIFAPNHDIRIIAKYIENCITGFVNDISLCALLKSTYISFEMFPNFFFSLSSSKYDFTTLIPFVFSSTTLLRTSYFLNTLSNIGCALLIITYRVIPITGISAKKINASFALIENDIISENISINGVRTTILVNI